MLLGNRLNPLACGCSRRFGRVACLFVLGSGISSGHLWGGVGKGEVDGCSEGEDAGGI